MKIEITSTVNHIEGVSKSTGNAYSFYKQICYLDVTKETGERYPEKFEMMVPDDMQPHGIPAGEYDIDLGRSLRVDGNSNLSFTRDLALIPLKVGVAK